MDLVSTRTMVRPARKRAEAPSVPSLMDVTFVFHSGFFVELESVCLLFDWWKGPLPDIPDGKPLLIFASHRHEDHFQPKIFEVERAAAYILGEDLKMTERRKKRWHVTPERLEKCWVLSGGESIEPIPGVVVETLHSTDVGVAYLITADGRTIFHAGDLNWWYWKDRTKEWNDNMGNTYKRYLEPIRGRHIDLAMAPIDPLLGENAFLGPGYLLDTADIDRLLPMHQWEEFDFTERFLERFPQYRDRVVQVRYNSQRFSFS